MLLPFRDHNPSRSFPLVTITLIVANALVFVYMVGLASKGEQSLNAFVLRAAVIPAAYTGEPAPPNYLHPFWLTTFTAMFMHAGVLHLGGNMLYLWIFGNNVEDAMGAGRFLLFYLICGVVATLSHILINPDSVVPALGASGAIAGVLGAYLVRYPRAQVDTCFFFVIVRLPALIVLAAWFVLQLYSGTGAMAAGASKGGTAFFAHIGGFLAGMILVNLFAKPRSMRYTYR